MKQYGALVAVWLFPVAWSAKEVILHTSLPCANTPFHELALLASIPTLTFTGTCDGFPSLVHFNATGRSEPELVAMLLRWELDVSYGGYELNAITVTAVNDVPIGPPPTKSFLNARQVSAPMGVALAAFASSGVASIVLVFSANAASLRPSSLYVVVSNTKSSFY